MVVFMRTNINSIEVCNYVGKLLPFSQAWEWNVNTGTSKVLLVRTKVKHMDKVKRKKDLYIYEVYT